MSIAHAAPSSATPTETFPPAEVTLHLSPFADGAHPLLRTMADAAVMLERECAAHWPPALPLPGHPGACRSMPHVALLRRGLLPSPLREPLWRLQCAVTRDAPDVYQRALAAAFGDDGPEGSGGVAAIEVDERFVPLFGGAAGLRGDSTSAGGTAGVFHPLTAAGAAELRRILGALAAAFPDVSYAPQLPSVVAALLLRLPSAADVYVACASLLREARGCAAGGSVGVDSVALSFPDGAGISGDGPRRPSTPPPVAGVATSLTPRSALAAAVAAQCPAPRLITGQREYKAALCTTAQLAAQRQPAAVATLRSFGVDVKDVFHRQCASLMACCLAPHQHARFVDAWLCEGADALHRVVLAYFDLMAFSVSKCATPGQARRLFATPSLLVVQDVRRLFGEGMVMPLGRIDTAPLESAHAARIDDLAPEAAAVEFAFIAADLAARETLRFRPSVLPTRCSSVVASWDALFVWLGPDVARLRRYFTPEQHGWSLPGLYRAGAQALDDWARNVGGQVPCLIVASGHVCHDQAADERKDAGPEGLDARRIVGPATTIGAFLSHTPQERRMNYMGTERTFVFCLDPRNEEGVFRPSGRGSGRADADEAPRPLPNKYFILPEESFLTIGGGESGAALRFSDDLAIVTSSPCTTFGSPSFTCPRVGGDPSAYLVVEKLEAYLCFTS